MMVPRREHQAKLLVQAVQNHNPQVLIVDEIGTKEVSDAPCRASLGPWGWPSLLHECTALAAQAAFSPTCGVCAMASISPV